MGAAKDTRAIAEVIDERNARGMRRIGCVAQNRKNSSQVAHYLMLDIRPITCISRQAVRRPVTSLASDLSAGIGAALSD